MVIFHGYVSHNQMVCPHFLVPTGHQVTNINPKSTPGWLSWSVPKHLFYFGFLRFLFLLTSSNTAPGNLLVFNKHGLGWDVNVHGTLMMLRCPLGLGWGGILTFMVRWWCYAARWGWGGVGLGWICIYIYMCVCVHVCLCQVTHTHIYIYIYMDI